MIGNDVVDLDLAEKTGRWQEKRYLQKVLTEKEQYLLDSESNFSHPFWRIWSLKEAAYKAHQRKYNLKPKINPRDFECNFLNSEEGLINIENSEYFCLTTIKDDLIYSVARDSEYPFTSNYFLNANIHVQFKDFLVKLLECSLQELSIKKNKNGIPFLLLKNVPLPAIFSLSHHGKYSAFTIQVNELLKAG